MATYYPPASFYFSVEFHEIAGMDKDIEQRFQEVGGLSFEVETEELRAGGENGFCYKLPKRVKYPNLVLKRGLLKGSALIAWLESARDSYFTVPINDPWFNTDSTVPAIDEWLKSAKNAYSESKVPDFKPADLFITLLDEVKQPAAIWNVVQAYPLKWAGSDFRATDNTIAVETIELAYQYFLRTL